MGEGESFSNSMYEEHPHLAERELSSLVTAVIHLRVIVHTERLIRRHCWILD